MTVTVTGPEIGSRTNATSLKRTLNLPFGFVLLCSVPQIGTNNCTARYRTLSGGIGESPSLSPSPSSDYEDIGATRHGLPPSLVAKAKKNGLPHKANTICQKAMVHHVSQLNASSPPLNMCACVCVSAECN